MEGTVDDLRLQVSKLSKICERSVVSQPTDMTRVLAPTPSSAAARPSAAGTLATRPNGNREELQFQDDGCGVVTTLNHHPVKGALSPSCALLNSSVPQFHGSSSIVQKHWGNSGNIGHIPKIPFPLFSGDQPKLWITRCEDYFELYSVAPVVWVKISTMHFMAAASRWLQTVETRLKSCSWHEFCALILARFGRDQHELLIRNLFHIKQTSSVAEYVERFSTLMDQLVAYGSHTDPLYFTMRFVDGLRDDIKSVVMVQRPSNWDSACVLAQLQEEACDLVRRPYPRRPDHYATLRPSAPVPMPLPPPPLKLDKVPVTQAADRRGLDSARVKSTDDKWATIKAYRQARGLCIKCAEKWSKDHRCAESIHLNAVQELFEILQWEDECHLVADTVDAPQDQLFLMVSSAAAFGKRSSHTLCLTGLIQGHSVRILLDSGSSHSFINTNVAAQLQGVVSLPLSLSVQVADGARLNCDTHFLDLVWSVQGFSFSSDFKILPISSYDAIVGMDWLTSFSPMYINWQQQWLVIPYQGVSVLLQGANNAVPDGTVIQLCTVTDTELTLSQSLEIHPKIQPVLDEFSALFSIPVDLPPPRACDHTIPLIAGASPVVMRPYRYAPTLKDEIE